VQLLRSATLEHGDWKSLASDSVAHDFFNGGNRAWLRPVHGGLGYAVSAGRIRRLDYATGRWTETQAAANDRLNGVASNPDGSLGILTSPGGGFGSVFASLYLSPDFGATWSHVKSDFTVSVSPPFRTRQGTLLVPGGVFGKRELHASVDGGKTWTPRGEFPLDRRLVAMPTQASWASMPARSGCSRSGTPTTRAAPGRRSTPTSTASPTSSPGTTSSPLPGCVAFHRIAGRMRAMISRLALAALTIACALPLASFGQPVAPAPAASAALPPHPGAPRPRVGLVLSGGGARGLAHVGVLKALERAHVRIDAIAGTSMGAIVGGLYASGMSADQLETELRRIDWDALFATRVPRPYLSQRRKEEDFEISTGLEFGVHDGQLSAPQGALSSRGLELLLRRLTLPVRHVDDFDRLPIPFRAVATDMETGKPVILSHGDLAVALRSSMSVPGVFAPTEVDGHILGDGGLVDNLPVDVARAMGVDVVIVVNVGTPIAGRASLSSVLGLTEQMIAILTEQNVERSIATLGPRDLLLDPDLGKLTSGDFSSAPQLIRIGEDYAETQAPKLAAYAAAPAEYAQWQAGHAQPAMPPTPLAAVQFEGSKTTYPGRFEARLQSQAGDLFDTRKAEADARRLAASGDYTRADYRLVAGPNGESLMFDLQDKPWGPNYLRAGLDLHADFSGHSGFDVKLSHNHHWLTANGTEWRNFVQIGERPAVFSELYHPLWRNIDDTSDWFAAAYLSGDRQHRSAYAADGTEIAQFLRSTGQVGFDVGLPFGRLGELRAGFVHLATSTTPTLLSSAWTGSQRAQIWQEDGLRVRGVVDQLDYVNFPTKGYRLDAEGVVGTRRLQRAEHMARGSLEGSVVDSFGRNTFELHGALKMSDENAQLAVDQYTLGGFQQLSGYRPDQLSGNAVLFGRLNWYMRLSQTPVFARGFFLGASLEAGNAWDDRSQLGLAHLRGGGSLYLGADTGLGPMYLGVTYAPRGELGIALFIGRP
jgi:NTE family protein